MARFIIGVDEAGRGPLAGPVSVGVVMAQHDFDITKHFPGVADSKQLSEKKREEIYSVLLAFQKNGEVQFRVEFSEPHIIDSIGITKAVAQALARGVRTLAPNSANIYVLLDGLLQAPKEYEQKTIVRGDQTEPIISLASIVAKVERDRLMKVLAERYPHYALGLHKGYGTRLHRAAIKEHGLSKIHRVTFCKKILSVA